MSFNKEDFDIIADQKSKFNNNINKLFTLYHASENSF